MSYVRWSSTSNWYAFPTDIGDGNRWLSLWHDDHGRARIRLDRCRDIIDGNQDLNWFADGFKNLSSADREKAMDLIREFIADVESEERADEQRDPSDDSAS
jgi:hypothetical protein